MQTLVFQLQAPLAAWGEAAVGEYRGSAEQPGQAALIGLLGAALGIDRGDEAAHAALRDGYGWVVGVLGDGRRPPGGQLLRDYHTAQVPPASTLKGRPHATRRDELAVPRRELTTILSTRDHRQNGAWLVVVVAREDAPIPHPLPALAQALRTPHYTLYLGRKACVPGAPLWPQLLGAADAQGAFAAYRALYEHQNQGRLEPLAPLARMHGDGVWPLGAPTTFSVPRKDRLIRRKGWQFGDRTEYVAVLDTQEMP